MDLIIKENGNAVRQDIITNNQGYNTSQKYVPIPTQEIINTISETIGYDPKIVGFVNANVRKKEKDSFQKHALMLQMKNADMVGGNLMRLTIFNSNDRSSAVKIYLSYHRKICSNGLIISSLDGKDEEPLSIRHTNIEWRHSIQSLMDTYEEKQQQVENQIEQMMNTYVSYGDQYRLTERVAEEILSPEITGSILDHSQLNVAHRQEDVGKTLFSLYQRIQYNLIQGKVDRVIKKEDDKKVLFNYISKTHCITDVNKQINFNKKLHSMVTELA